VDESPAAGGAPLSADRLYRHADLSGLPFTTTVDLLPVDGLAGQPRALDALRLGTRIEKPGFNLFVIGPPGARMSEAVQAMLRRTAETYPVGESTG
jgi:AAA domain